jgi:hypothetical protein
MSIGLRLSLAVLFLVLGKINLRTSPDRATTRWFYNPCLSSGFLCCVMLMDRVTARTILVYSGVFTFLVDAYPTFAASALAANSFTRSSFGGIFPLFGMQSKFVCALSMLGQDWKPVLCMKRIFPMRVDALHFEQAYL